MIRFVFNGYFFICGYLFMLFGKINKIIYDKYNCFYYCWVFLMYDGFRDVKIMKYVSYWF